MKSIYAGITGKPVGYENMLKIKLVVGAARTSMVE